MTLRTRISVLYVNSDIAICIDNIGVSCTYILRPIPTSFFHYFINSNLHCLW